MNVDQNLINAAIRQALERWPEEEAGAAAMYTSAGDLLTSVYVEAPNVAVELCHETGAVCEAHRRNVSITASVCVSREHKDAPFIILSPRGVCQERLAYWGGDVSVAVPHPEDPALWQAKKLKNLMPFYWRRALEPF